MIDFHTHFFSRVFFEALISQIETPVNSDNMLTRLSERASIEIPDRSIDAHSQKWLEEMNTHRLQHLVTFASLPQEAEAVAEALKISKERFSGFVLVNPLAPDAAAFTNECAVKGFKGILLFPVMHNFHANDPRVWNILDVAAQHKMIVTIHFGLLQIGLRDILGLPRPYDLKFGNPLDLQKTANKFNKTPFVIPHFGCGFFRETLMIGSQCENVYVDTSSSNSWITTQTEKTTLAKVFERALEVYTAERILFGTDSSTFPRGWRHDIYQTQNSILDTIGLQPGDKELIFEKNASRLLNLKSTLTA